MTTPVAQRSAHLLGLSWAFSWAGLLVGAAFGSVVVLRMTGNLALTGIPYMLIYVGSLLAAYPAGHYMDRLGRKPVLIVGHLAAAAGLVVGAFAIHASNVWLFFGGHLVYSMGIAATYLTRLAAADLYPARERAGGLGRLAAYLVLGAVASVPIMKGAQLVQARLGYDYLLVGWAFIPVLSLVAALLVSRITPDPSVTARELHALEPEVIANAPQGPMPLRIILAAGATLLFAQAAMASMMSVTGAALTKAGHSPDFIILTLTVHVVGMFGFSPLVGVIGDRWGRKTLLLTSSIYLGASTLLTRFIPVGTALAITLIGVGIGWSFAFIGSTTIVADNVPIARRGRVTGVLDAATAIVGAAGSAAAGWALQNGGIQEVALLGMVLAFGVFAAAVSAPRLRATLAGLGRPADNVGK